MNNVLRKQLEEALENNEALTTDLHKLSLDFGALQEELIMKEDEWKDEEQVSSVHFYQINLVLIFKKLFSIK